MADNMFPTQIPISQRNSISLPPSTIQTISYSKSPTIRVREAKLKMKKADQQFNTTMKDFLKTKNTLDKTNQRAQKLRMEFLKLYGNKKLRLQEKSLLEDKKNFDEKNKIQQNKRVKALKLSNDLGLMYTKNESQLNQAKLRELNKKDQQEFKKQIQMKKQEWGNEAKDKYLQVKKGQADFIIRKKNMSAIESTRSRHNYLVKVSRQLQLLENYNDLIEKVNNVSMTLTTNSMRYNNEPKTSFSKSFFITTKNTIKE